MNAAMATPGARLMYAQIVAADSAGRDPLPEVFQPVIHRGESPVAAVVDPFTGEPPTRVRLFLAKTENPQQAYFLTGKPSKPLNHHAEGWGEIHYAIILPRKHDEETLTFLAPHPSQAKHVVIKKLAKQVVREYLSIGGHEDPYKEISRMQELGDGRHVLECVEALEDDAFLYIITPNAREGSLVMHLPWNQGYPPDEAKALFQNILEILLYLERHGIFHHDLSPDNLLFFDGRLVLFDFAMSIRIPRDENGQRYLVKPQGVYGTFPCQAPEVFFNQYPFDGVGADLWAAVVILYTLLTGTHLYKLPHPVDILFRYYILAGGLKPGLNEEMVEILESAFQPDSPEDGDSLMAHAMANLNIPPDALEVLLGVLNIDPAKRWTLMQTVESTWVQSP